MFLSLSAVNASWIRFLASRYLTIASAVSSDDAEMSRSISTAVGLAAENALAGDREALDVLRRRRRLGIRKVLGFGRGSGPDTTREKTASRDSGLFIRWPLVCWMHVGVGCSPLGRKVPGTCACAGKR